MPAPVDGDHALPLRIALPVCHAYGLALAGGYAIRAHGLISRPSDDLDLATAATTPVQEIVDALAEAYRAAMYGDQEFGVDGVGQDEIAAIRAWAQAWSDELTEDLAKRAALDPGREPT